MSLDTYAGLLTFLEGHAHRDDLTALIPDFIRQAEDEARNHLRSLRAQAVAISTPDAASTTLPSNFGGAISLRMTADPYAPVQFRTIDQMNDLRSSYRSQTGRPTDFSIIGSSLVIHPDPAEGYEVELTYWIGLPALSDAATSNWLLLKNSGVYVDGAMWKLHEYTFDEQRADRRRGQFFAGIDNILQASLNDTLAERLTPNPTLVV